MEQASAPGSNAAPTEGQARVARRPRVVRLVVLALAVTAGIALWRGLHDQLSLQQLAAREAALRAARESHPVAVYAAAFGMVVAILALSLPGASVLTPALGWYFGFWPALLLASFASTTGATLAFLMSRYVFRDVVERQFADRLRIVNAALERDGAYYLLVLRLVPAFPFFVINLVLGLTRMNVATFWWVSQLGMLPGTCLFVYAGTTVPTLAELADGSRPLVNRELLLALAALGLLPLGLRYLVQRFRRDPPPAA